MLINFYGFFIALGILAGAWTAERFRKKFSLLITHYSLLSVYDLLLWVLIPGIIGARLYHVIDYWQYYQADLSKVFYVWQGGLGIFGGIIGGVIGIFIFSFLQEIHLAQKQNLTRFSKRRRTSLIFLIKPSAPANLRKHSQICFFRREFLKQVNKRFLLLLDLAAIGLPLGQAIGRFGNFFNQELYGLPANLAWAIYIKPENRLPGWESFQYFHPLFLYESLGCLIIFIILLILISHYSLLITRKKSGTLFFLYLFLYSFLRFWLEFLRIRSWLVWGFRFNQVLAVFLMALSLAFLLLYNHKKSVIK